MVTSLAVLDGNLKQLPLFKLRGKRRIGLFDPQPSLLADELQPCIAHQRAGKQSRFTENLKTVANAQDHAAVSSEFLNAPHNRRETRHCAAAEIIAIGKAARQYQTVEMSQKLIFVPEKLHLLAHLSFEAIENVLIVARAWKNNHSPTHVITP